MADNESHREYCRRQHRILANFLMMRCWKLGADFAVVPRQALEKWLKIKRFDGARKGWLETDISILFPYSQLLNFTNTPTKFASLYASRKELDDANFGTSMGDEERINKLADDGLVGTLVDTNEIMTEADIVREFALIAAGMSDFDFAKSK